MKQIKFFVWFGLAILTLASCKKSSSSPVPSQSISLKFNGTQKSSSTVVASLYTSESTLQVLGTFGSEGVSLMIQNPKVGTFDASNGSVVASYSSGADLADTYLADNGTITITSMTSEAVSGTFQFTGTNQSNVTGTVTEGKFSAKLTKLNR